MLPLFQQLGVVAFGKVRPTARRISRTILGGALVALLALTTYVSLLLALGFYLSSLVGPALASVIIAGGTGVLALIVVAVIQVRNRRAELKMEARQRAARARLPDPMTLQLLAGIPALMKGRSLLGVATVAALVFGLTKMRGDDRDPRDHRD